MKPLSELTKDDIRDLKLVVFDVDGVTIKKGTSIEEIKTTSETKFTIRTNNLTQEMKNKLFELKQKYFVAICSGRSSLYLTDVFNDLLWDNFALISEIGIFTLINGELKQNRKFGLKELEKMKLIKNDLAKLVGDKPNMADFELKQFLITLHASHELPEVYEIMKRHDPDEEFYCLWNGEAFDIAPKILDKGQSIKFLAKELGIGIHQTMASGNGINDKSMTDATGIGITTDKKSLESDYYTEGNEELGGFEIIDKLLELSK
ncbi:MAG: Cof-like protein hydrolase [uncultured bacterium]|nr:MAG: Cof-like protein hydrolase [uncultured bacterium]